MVTKGTENSKECTTSAEAQKLLIFVHSDLDDFGLDPYEFRVYARIARRAGKGNAFESIKGMALGCRMSEGKLKSSLRSLIEKRLVKRVSRPGTTTVYRLTLITDWVVPESQNLDDVVDSDEPSTPDVRPIEGVDTEQPGSLGVHLLGHEMSGGESPDVRPPGHEMSTTKVFPLSSSTSFSQELVEEQDLAATKQPPFEGVSAAAVCDKEKAIEEVCAIAAKQNYILKPEQRDVLNTLSFKGVSVFLDNLAQFKKAVTREQKIKGFDHALRVGARIASVHAALKESA